MKKALDILDFIKAVGKIFSSFCSNIEKRKDNEFSETNKLFQLYRRSRYVIQLDLRSGTLWSESTEGLNPF